jgi:hypothetical protein
MKICPNCQTHNREGVLFCEDCGQPLKDTPSMATREFKRSDAPPQLKPETWGTARISDKSQIVIHVRDVAEPVIMSSSPRMVMGRLDLVNGNKPDLDLTPFGAQEKGVSRVHAALQRSDETLSLIDLGSVNGTHLNGQLLAPNQPRILRDGDEIRLGKLILNIYFM